MKCLSKKISFFLIISVIVLSLYGCKEKEIDVPYGFLSGNEKYDLEYNVLQKNVKFFASDLCAVSSDFVDNSDIDRSMIYSAAVFDINNSNVLYAYNANMAVNPASITKIMTTLVVLDNCSLDEVVTVPDVTIYESGAQLFNIKEGDRITVENLLYAHLVYSGNDASLALAKYVSGTEEEFCNLMNEKAAKLGCTGTHFSNSNGLTAEDHYTTAYDLYLIFSEALKYPILEQIIGTSSYEVTYTNADGEFASRTVSSTDKFLSGEYKVPDGITVVGGKTGSTNAAGKCLMLCVKDRNGNPYIAIVMGAPDEQTLYTMMADLLDDTIN